MIYLQADMRIIKRYYNRKYYDTYKSSYVSFIELSEIFKNSNGIKVLDEISGKNITIDTLYKILLETGRKNGDVKRKLLSILRGEAMHSDNSAKITTEVKKIISKLNLPTRKEIKIINNKIKKLSSSNGRKKK